jgi:hypothetical protein
LSRKNYATLEHKGKIKLTGNTIKSKKLPQYIEVFLDKGIKMLLEGNGHEFVEWYYEYIEKIYNKQIPLQQIASRAKVKVSIDDYKVRCTQKTKSGALMSRQAHMELVIRNNLHVNLGDIIMYVNNGTKASHGDVQKVNKPKKGWNDEQIQTNFSSNADYKEKEKFLLKNGWSKSWSEDNWVRNDAINRESNTGVPTDVAYQRAIADKSESFIQINCYMLDPSELEKNPEMLGDYNVPRAISTFNKRIEPLLIVFGEEVRSTLIIENPENREFYTKTQCELISGQPFEPEDQDSVEDLLTISDAEVKFWEKVNISPDYIYELAEEDWMEKI